MGLWDKIFGEFVDIIDWTDDSNDTMVYRFERYGNEIKFGAKLTVRESQVAVFVNEGEVADVLGPGIYELETRNLPILSTLQHWDHGFESPFKAEVYFFNMRQFTDLKWGTKNPVMMRDKEFGAVRLRTFGTYTMRIKDPAKFIREIVGTDGHFTVDEISNQLRDLIVTRYTNILGHSDIPVLDLAGNQDQLGEFITQRIAPEFEDYGLELTKVLVENISLPPAVEEALDKRTSMGMIGNLDQYLKFGAGESMSSGNNTASGAIEMGMGFAMANQMSKQLTDGNTNNDSPAKQQGNTPPPLPDSVWHIAINDKITGPYSLDELEQLRADNKLNAQSLAWKNGMQNWQAAGEIDALKTLLGDKALTKSTPPKLPKS
jgi:membrane protease subunit (stomatin/prohibitin family)